MYVLNFGADPTTMFVMFVIIAFWNPINDMIIGHMQESGISNRYFDEEKWGRYAPFFLIHLFVASATIVLAYLPYQLDLEGNQVHAVYFIVCFVGYWAFSNMFISFYSSVVELYPFKEERMEVEGWSVFFSIVSVLVCIGGVAGALTKPQLSLPIGVVLAAACFFSLIGLPIMKQANSPAKPPTLFEATSCGA